MPSWETRRGLRSWHTGGGAARPEHGRALGSRLRPPHGRSDRPARRSGTGRRSSSAQQAAELWREIGDNRGLAHDLVQLSIAAAPAGAISRALSTSPVRRWPSSTVWARRGDIAGTLVVVAAAAERLGEVQAAARILSAEDAFARKTGIGPCDSALAAGLRFNSRCSSGDTRGGGLRRGMECGRQNVYRGSGRVRIDGETASTGHRAWSGRGLQTWRASRSGEREVAMLVAGGMTDQEISKQTGDQPPHRGKPCSTPRPPEARLPLARRPH
jgi:hypothetical protein